MRLVLASSSPRRRELLARLSVPFEVRAVDLDEETTGARDPQIAARRVARAKAEAARLLDETSAILAADTIVWFDGRSLGKPGDDAAARAMLLSLRGKTHDVVTAVAVMRASGRSAIIRHPVTRVQMRDYSDDEIEVSLRRGDPFDKAGAYGIQDQEMRPVAAYLGCYCNVVGLPLWPTIEALRKVGIDVPSSVGELLPQCAACPLRLPD